MADLNTLETQLKKTEKQLGKYTSDLPSQIETEIQKAYTPLLQEALGVTKDLSSDYLGRFMDTTSMGRGMTGSSAADLSPSQKMGVMGRELGTMSGQLQSAVKYADYLGAQMNDLYGKAVNAANAGKTALAEEYARRFQRYQLAWQEAENAKDRALQRALSGGGGGWSFGTDTGGTGGDDFSIDTGEESSGQQPQRQPNWADKFIKSKLAADYSNPNLPTWQRVVGALNPASAFKTAGGLAGNLAGNWNNTSMSFLDKLFNRRE